MGLESTTLVAACTRQLHATRRLERSDEWSKARCKVLKSGLPLQTWALWNYVCNVHSSTVKAKPVKPTCRTGAQQPNPCGPLWEVCFGKLLRCPRDGDGAVEADHVLLAMPNFNFSAAPGSTPQRF